MRKKLLVGLVAAVLAVPAVLYIYWPEDGPLRIGFTEEFMSRADGCPIVEEVYGFSFKGAPIAIYPPDEIYPAFLKKEVDIISGFQTSGYNLPDKWKFRILEDDRSCFSEYEAVPLTRSDVIERNPWLMAIFKAIENTFAGELMVRLNYRVDLGGETLTEVAGSAIRKMNLPAVAPADRGGNETLIIGSKDFTEARLLAEIMAQAIESVSDAKVVRKIDLGPTRTCFMALVAGEIDLYADYTGTLWFLLRIEADRKRFLGDENMERLRNRLKDDYGLTVLPRFGFNNSYVIAMRERRARNLGIRTISDLAAYISKHPEHYRDTAMRGEAERLPPVAMGAPKIARQERENQERRVVAPKRRELERLRKSPKEGATDHLRAYLIRAKSAELIAEEALLEVKSAVFEFIQRETDPEWLKRRHDPEKQVSMTIEDLARLQQLERARMKEEEAWNTTALALRRYLDVINHSISEGGEAGLKARRAEVIAHLAYIHDRRQTAKAHLKLIGRHIRLAGDRADVAERITDVPAAGEDLASQARHLELLAELIRKRADIAGRAWAIATETVRLKQAEIARLESQPFVIERGEGAAESLDPEAVSRIRAIEKQIQEAESLLGLLRGWNIQQERQAKALENSASRMEKRAADARAKADREKRQTRTRDAIRLASAGLFVVLTILAAVWTTRKMRETERWLDKTTAEEEGARRIHTPYVMIRRILVPVICIIGTVVVLIHFQGFRQWGITFLASAGVLSLIFGLAARGSFENFFAGLTLCFSQPVRIGDSVKIDGELGTIEDIGLMHTTFKVWDNRRILIPNEAMARKSIDNYTIRESALLMKIPFYLDPRTDLDRAAEILKGAVRESSHWSRKGEPQVWFMQATEKSIEVWVAGWTENAAEGWALRTDVLQNGLQALKREGISFPVTRIAR